MYRPLILLSFMAVVVAWDKPELAVLGSILPRSFFW